MGVADDIKVNQTTVIKLNSVVNGTVTESVAKRRLGRTGRLDFSVDTINAMDGGKIPVRYTIMKKEGGSHVVRTGVVAALVAMTYPPAAPLVLLATGKDVTLYRGLIFQVFTDTDYEMNSESDAPPQKIMISVTSDTPKVDLYIDDTLYGVLPKTPMVTPGDRHVFRWQLNKDFFCVREFAIARFLELNEVPTEKGCAKK